MLPHSHAREHNLSSTGVSRMASCSARKEPLWKQSSPQGTRPITSPSSFTKSRRVQRKPGDRSGQRPLFRSTTAHAIGARVAGEVQRVIWPQRRIWRKRCAGVGGSLSTSCARLRLVVPEQNNCPGPFFFRWFALNLILFYSRPH